MAQGKQLSKFERNPYIRLAKLVLEGGTNAALPYVYVLPKMDHSYTFSFLASLFFFLFIACSVLYL